MDSLRGRFSGDAGSGDDARDPDYGEDEPSRELPPAAIGQDERRMQVRAYNFWASMLDNRNFPSVDQLDPNDLPDFGPYSVLLDFTGGIDNPAIRFLGDKLAEECGAEGPIRYLADVPRRSLLSRITDHYMQILANQAPIGFEAEFVNQRGSTILYRGILLPFAAADDRIDFIYGVINWKELADQQTTDELLLEIDQVLEAKPEVVREEAPLTEWADGPADDGGVLDLTTPFEPEQGLVDWPTPGFGSDAPVEDDDEELPVAADDAAEDASAVEDEDEDEEEEQSRYASLTSMGAREQKGYMHFPALRTDDAADELDASVEDAGDEAVYDGEGYSAEPYDADAYDDDEVLEPQFGAPLASSDAEDMGLADWLASARELAEAARGSEDRSRQALYAALGRAYDFSLAAALEPEEFKELLEDAGITIQERAPLTPVVKLVFGADYDKTRLAEYASALGYAHRLQLARGEFADHLAGAAGGLKGVVAGERRLRREEAGKPVAPRDAPRKTIQRKLRKLAYQPLSEVAAEGGEFTLLVARRLKYGEVVLLGEVGDDIQLLERAAKKLIG